jgi:hypothetical protein
VEAGIGGTGTRESVKGELGRSDRQIKFDIIYIYNTR